jgi:hypothetical protein
MGNLMGSDQLRFNRDLDYGNVSSEADAQGFNARNVVGGMMNDASGIQPNAGRMLIGGLMQSLGLAGAAGGYGKTAPTTPGVPPPAGTPGVGLRVPRGPSIGLRY